MVKSPGSGIERLAATQDGSHGRRDRNDEASRVLADLEATRRELASANRRIAKLLHDRKRSRISIDRLKSLAMTDALTKAVNRRRFDQVLHENFANSVIRGTPLSVIMVDVDWFKSYNDTFGHAAGDFVLCVVARHLIQSARTSDVVARYGGDEFTVLLNDTDEVVALNCAERYRQAVISFQWPLRPVTASFGVATRSASIETASALVEEADRALYHSKRGGRTQVIHLGLLNARDSSAQAAQYTSPDRTETPVVDACVRPWGVAPFHHSKPSKGDIDRVEDDPQSTPEREARSGE